MRPLLALVGALGCTHPTSPEQNQAPGSNAAAAVGPGDEVVATVAGRPITAADVALQARAVGATPRAALEALVGAELAAAEAERRGLPSDPAVTEARQKALVHRYLARTIDQLTPADVPDNDLRRVFARNRIRFDHDDVMDVHHILVSVGKTDTPEAKEAKRRRADEVARKAREVSSIDEFDALAKLPGEIPLREESVSTMRNARWTVKPFTDACFTLNTDGQVSGVIETDFGFHIIYREHVTPAEHLDFEHAIPRLREATFADFKKREFLRMTQSLAATHQVVINAKKLDDL